VKKLGRKKLEGHARRYLERKTQEILARPAGDRAALAAAMWKGARRTQAFRTIKSTLRRMASGRARCMYCEDSAGVAIDHFWPLAGYPHRAFRWKNYLYACTWCNSNYKRDRFPVSWISGAPLLIKPTLDDPLIHLAFDPDTGNFDARTPKGGMSIHIFGLNERSDLPGGRLDTLLAMQYLIPKYAELQALGDVASAAKIERVVRAHPFSSILCHVLVLAAGSGAVRLDPDLVAALQARPEIQGWV
jgi:hypothetical protein